MNLDKIKEKLSEKDLEGLAKQSGFIKQQRYQITPYAYVMGFFEMLKKGFNTVELWASEIYQLTGFWVSAQAVQHRIQYPQADFCRLLLEGILSDQLHRSSLFKEKNKLLSAFNEVLVEDSSCVTLPKCLMEIFPGAVNQQGKSSSARIQLRVELKKMVYKATNLQSYRDNDQKHASDILNQAKAGDLVIRDLGYHVVKVFKEMVGEDIFFLSRLLYGNHLYDKTSEEQLNLSKQLRKLRIKGGKILDLEVLLGKAKVPVRLIAIKASARIEQQRKRKANKDRRAKRTKDYMERLAWTIFITNVPAKIWKPLDAMQVYTYRWHIEIIFKCWKQQLDFKRLLKTKHSLSPPRAEINFYLILIWLTICYTYLYTHLLIVVYQTTGRILSMLKFKAYLANQSQWSQLDKPDEKEIRFLAKYFAQTKRKEKSHIELLYQLNTS